MRTIGETIFNGLDNISRKNSGHRQEGNTAEILYSAMPINCLSPNQRLMRRENHMEHWKKSIPEKQKGIM